MIACKCGATVAGPPGSTITCGHCGRVQQLAGEPTPRIQRTFSPFAIARRAVCEPCPHRISETCGLLRAQGKPGHLWHPHGLPNPAARFPAGCPLESSL